MNYFQIESVSSKIREAFEGIERPDLRAILTLGCCEEHEEDFTWYRHHSWEELSLEILNEGLDWVDFSVIHPLAYHYFVPAILTATLESIVSGAQRHNLKGYDWLSTLIPAEDRAKEFERNYLSMFSSQQIETVRSHLKFVQSWIIEQRGYSDDDLERGIKKIWI